MFFLQPLMEAGSVFHNKLYIWLGLPTIHVFVLVVAVVCPLEARGQVKARWNDFSFLDVPPDKLHIEAENLSARGEGGPILLSGGVRVQGTDLEIRADWMEILASEEKVVFSGSVRVVERNSVLLADRIELNRESSHAVLSRAVILVKEDISVQKLQQCKLASQLVEAGFNSFVLQGRKLVREGDRYYVREARFTACDCGQEPPSWELRAYKADVEPNQRAWLYWPRLYIKGLPVFIFPVAYIPLSERRSGLLFPQISYSGRDGFVLSESLYLTLGERADTTLTLDWFEERGYRERFEFRSRPTRLSSIDTRWMYMDDQKLAGDEVMRHLRSRYSAELDAWWQNESGTSVKASALIYSDSNIKSDFASEMVGRAAESTTSSLVTAKRGYDQIVAMELTYVQDLRFRGVDLLGSAPDDPLQSQIQDTIHRLGVFSYALAPMQPEGWPFTFSLGMETANFTSLSAAWRDWGRDGTPDRQEPRYSDPVQTDDHSSDNQPGGEGDGELGDGELRRALRLVVEPEMQLVWKLGSALGVNTRISHRQLVYAPHGPGAPGVSARGLTFFHLDLRSELARTFGSDSQRIGHLISPWVSLAGVWQGLAYGGGAAHTFDWRDRITEDAQQVLLGADTGLYRQQGRAGFVEFLKLRLCQGLDLQTRRLAQAAFGLDLRFPGVAAQTVVGVDWASSRLAESNLTLRWADRRIGWLRLSYLFLPSVRDSRGRPLPLSERVQRESDLLFGTSPAYYRALGETTHVVEGTASVNLGWGLGLSAGGSLDIRDMRLAYYKGSVHYKSDCRCWGFSLMVRMMRGQDFPDIFFSLDLAYLGSFGLKAHEVF